MVKSPLNMSLASLALKTDPHESCFYGFLIRCHEIEITGGYYAACIELDGSASHYDRCGGYSLKLQCAESLGK